MNVELAQAALRDARANPDRFDMAVFWGAWEDIIKDSADMTVPPCGTTGCFAGFAALRFAPVGTRIAMGTMDRGSRVVLPGQSEREAADTEQYAARALGITRYQAGVLFFLADIGEVERAVNFLADNPAASVESLSDAAGGW